MGKTVTEAFDVFVVLEDLLQDEGNDMKMRLLNNRVLVKRDEEVFVHEKESVNEMLRKGELFLPERQEGILKKVAGSGTIISWGPACKYSDHYKPGRRVWFEQFSGTRFDVRRKDEVLLLEDDIHGVDEDD